MVSKICGSFDGRMHIINPERPRTATETFQDWFFQQSVSAALLDAINVRRRIREHDCPSILTSIVGIFGVLEKH